MPRTSAYPASPITDEIATWLGRPAKGRVRVVFSTYQSCRVLADAARATGTVFDLGIMNEAHKTVGQKRKSSAICFSMRMCTLIGASL